MRVDMFDCVAHWVFVGLLIGVIAAGSYAVAHLTPASVTVRDEHDSFVRKYAIPDGYSYSDGGMTATGDVITITAEYRKETK